MLKSFIAFIELAIRVVAVVFKLVGRIIRLEASVTVVDQADLDTLNADVKTLQDKVAELESLVG